MISRRRSHLTMNDYISEFRIVYDTQKVDSLMGIQAIRDTISSTISLDHGIHMIEQSHPGIEEEEILKKLTTKDLLYLSLLEETPLKIDALRSIYSVKIQGIRFGAYRAAKYAAYKPSLNYLIQNQRDILKRTFDNVLEEGESIFRYFHNNNQTKTGKRNFTELNTGQNISGLLEGISNVFSGQTDKKEAHCLFTYAGLILIGPDKDFEFLQFNQQGQEQISKHLKGYRKASPPRIQGSTKDQLNRFRSVFSTTLEQEVDNALRHLKRKGKIGPIDRKAVELEDEYGVKVNYLKINQSRQIFYPRLSEADIDVLSNMLEVMAGMSNLYLSDIFKAEPPIGYNGIDTAKLANRRVASYYTNILRDKNDANMIFKLKAGFSDGGFQNGEVSFDAVDLDSLKIDFDRYMPFQLQRIAHIIFTQLPDQLRDEYAQSVKDSIKKQMSIISPYGYSAKHCTIPLAGIDFMKSAAEYQLAKNENRANNLDLHRNSFFDRLFNLRLE